MDVRVGPQRRLSTKELMLLNCGCLREQFESGNGSNEELIKEAVQLLVKSR